MSDNPIPNVNRVEPQTLKTIQAQTPQVISQIQSEVEAIAPERVNQTVKDDPAKMANQDAKQQTAGEPKKETTQKVPLQDRQTALRFRVDAKTNEVTMLIVDKSSDKVISTIPPEAIKDLPSGEIFQYSA